MTFCRYKDLAAGIASLDTAILATAHNAAVTSVPSICESQSNLDRKLPDAGAAADRILAILGEHQNSAFQL